MTAEEFSRQVVDRMVRDFSPELVYDDLLLFELTVVIRKLAQCYLTRARNKPKYLVMNAKMGTHRSTKYCRYICRSIVEQAGGWPEYNELGGITLARALIRTMADVDPEHATEVINDCAL